MKEVLSLSLGPNSNVNISHFWKIQEMYFEEPTSYHESFYINLQAKYLPRSVQMDFGLCLQASIPEDLELPWEGKIDDRTTQANLPGPYQELLEATVQPANLLNLYNENNSEAIEEKVRWLAESAERTQGWHILMDWALYTEVAQTLSVVEDFYPKLPVLLMSDEPTYSIETSTLLYEMKEYSHLIHVPCADIMPSQGLLAIGLEVLTHEYRSFVPNSLGEFLSPIFYWPRGNIAKLRVNQREPNCIAVGTVKEEVKLPEGFPVQVDMPISSALQIEGSLAEFIWGFEVDRSCGDRDIAQEINEYLLSVKESIENLPG